MPTAFFTPFEEHQIVTAIRESEALTSAEIRVHVHESLSENPQMEAIHTFQALGMDKTALRNGVLFFVAPYHKYFVVLGDKGINEKVPDGFWNDVKDIVIKNFRHGDIANGLCEGICIAGEQLKLHFPISTNDKDELPNTISYK